MRTRTLLLGALSLAALTFVFTSSADAQRRHHRRGGPGWHQQAAPQPMDPASFDAFLARIGNASFSSDRVAAVEGVAPHAYFTAAQIARVVGAMTFSSERVRAAELLIPHLLDPVNGGVIVDAMTFSSERERAQQLLAQLPPRTYQPTGW